MGVKIVKILNNMDKKWIDKCHASRANILRCIDEAYKMKNMDLMYKNFQRLHQLTAHYERLLVMHLNDVTILKAENESLEISNMNLRDENFMLLSKSLGENAYKTAKKLMDEFHEKWELEYGT